MVVVGVIVALLALLEAVVDERLGRPLAEGLKFLTVLELPEARIARAGLLNDIVPFLADLLILDQVQAIF